jgi:tetratricopeptide (TPR) repeat protein
MLDLGRPDRAADYARRSLAADSQRVMSHFVLGVLAQKAARYDEALAAFQKAEEANRLRKGSVVLKLHASMADCLARLGREAEAEREFQAELAAIPWSPEGRIGHAARDGPHDVERVERRHACPGFSDIHARVRQVEPF